jgi:hypothetical protein
MSAQARYQDLRGLDCPIQPNVSMDSERRAVEALLTHWRHQDGDRPLLNSRRIASLIHQAYERGRSRHSAMTPITFEEGALKVDATIIGQCLGIEPARVQDLMRERKITCLCERGIDHDAGRYRLTFFYGNVRFRLVVDEAGNVVQHSAVDFGDRRLPASMRKSHS